MPASSQSPSSGRPPVTGEPPWAFDESAGGASDARRGGIQDTPRQLRRRDGRDPQRGGAYDQRGSTYDPRRDAYDPPRRDVYDPPRGGGYDAQRGDAYDPSRGGAYDSARGPAHEQPGVAGDGQQRSGPGRTQRGGPPWDNSGPPWGNSGPPWETSQPPGEAAPPWPVAEPAPALAPTPAPARMPARRGPDPTRPEPAGRETAGRELAARTASLPSRLPPDPGSSGTSQPGRIPGGPTAPTGYGTADPTSTGSLPAITGGLIRRQGTFTGRITRDGSSGYPAEPARYQLYASLACPWSQRALIVCRLLGLDRVIGLTLTDPVADEHGWRFSEDAGDPLTGARLLSDLYRATDPGYTGPCSIPLIWDMHSRKILSNDVAQITVMLETEFRQFHRQGAPDLYPAARRRDIESLATLIFHTVNTGVYKAGLAATQASYEQAVEAVFTTLDALEERLARRRFLLGDQLTEADIRLYPTLARFDAVYYQLLGCNLRRLSDYPHLWAYARDLYTYPGFGETTDLTQIKRHYYQSAEWGAFHKSDIIPIGPEIDWTEPHGRSRMPG